MFKPCLVAGMAVLVLAPVGCGVTLDSRRVAHPIPSFVPGNGIVYALPRTEFEVVQPAKLSVPTAGALSGVIDACERACDSTNNNVRDDSCSFSSLPEVKLLPPDLRTTAAPDKERLYQISPSADVFKSMEFKFDIASNGVLDKADTKASNMGYEVLSVVAKSAITAFSVPSATMATSMKNKSGGAGRSCYQISNDVRELVKPKTGKLSCPLVKEIRACMTPFEKEVGDEHAALAKIFDTAAASKMHPKLLAALAENRKERIAAASGKRDNAAALYGLAEGKPKEADFEVALSLHGPREFTDYRDSVVLSASIRAGTARIQGISDAAAPLASALASSLKDESRTYVVTSTMPEGVTSTGSVSESAVTGGYRYRVPTAALTTLTAYSAPDKVAASDGIVSGPFVTRKTIAQYGPIAMLTSRFHGKGGRVMVKHWPDSGGLQTIEIGAEALPTSSVTGVLDEAFNQYKARKDKAVADAAAAAAADPELDSLKRQQQVLSLQKQIKDLEEALKK